MTYSATVLDFPNILQRYLCCLAKALSNVTERSSSMHFFMFIRFYFNDKLCLMEPGNSLGNSSPLGCVIVHIKKAKRIFEIVWSLFLKSVK